MNKLTKTEIRQAIIDIKPLVKKPSKIQIINAIKINRMFLTPIPDIVSILTQNE
jgi:hypothetical protein